MKTSRKIISLCLALLMLTALCTAAFAEEEPEKLAIAALKGPTAMGLVKLMEETDSSEELQKK